MKVRPPYWFLLIALVPLTAVICAVLLGDLINREIQEKNCLNERTDNFRECKVDTGNWVSKKIYRAPDGFGDWTYQQQREWYQKQVVEDWKRENSWLFKEYEPKNESPCVSKEDSLIDIWRSVVPAGNSYPKTDYTPPLNYQIYHALERIEKLEKQVKELKEAQ